MKNGVVWSSAPTTSSAASNAPNAEPGKPRRSDSSKSPTASEREERDEDRQPVPGPDLRPDNREKRRKATGRRDEDRGKRQRCEAAKRRIAPGQRAHDGEQRHADQPEEPDGPDDARASPRFPSFCGICCGVLRLLRRQRVDSMAVHR